MDASLSAGSSPSEHQSLIKSEPSDDEEVSPAVLTRARNAYLTWNFFSSISFGIMIELYSELFTYVIDPNSVTKAAFYSTLGMSMYSVTSFLFSPVFATLTDTIGRRPIFLLAAVVDSCVGITTGLAKSNWVYVTCMLLMGAGDNSLATGMATLSAFVTGTPKGFPGSSEDSWFFRQLYYCVRLGGGGASEASGHDQAAYLKAELATQFTVLLIVQVTGSAIGVISGDALYSATGSYSWSYAAAGFIVLPLIPFLWWYMPETVPAQRRKPFNCAALGEAFATQVDSVHLFLGNRRMFGLLLVSFLIQFVSAGIFDVVLYWGEWKFGWGTTTDALALFLAVFAEVIGAVTGPAILVSRFGFKTSSLLAILFAVGATACVPTALVASSAAAIASLVFFALALGAIPILNAQISNEASVEMQGRVAGFNYAVMTLAWVSSPYAYYYMFAGTITDDDDQTHSHNVTSSLIWWVTLGILALSSALVSAFVPESKESKLVP